MNIFKISTTEKKTLREFGLVMGLFLVLVFGLLLPGLHGFQTELWSYQYQNYSFPIWPWLAALFFWFWSLLLPIFLKPIYKLWMAIGHVLGWINTRIILSIVFFIVMLPMAILLKIFGKDPMRRKLDKNLPSYRVSTSTHPKTHLEKPY